MSTAAACGGWIAAGVLTALWVAVQKVVDKRMEAVARACHELRGPIGAARLGLELGSRAGTLSAEQLRAIDSELGRATLALEDLARAPHGRSAPREAGPVDLESLLTETVTAWAPSAAAAGVSLRMRWTGGTSPVRADRLRLAQATSNLIANAIEHGGEWVEVRGCSEPPRAGTAQGGSDRAVAARIEVIDDGRGLPAPLDELTRRPRRGRGGRGRGLAIAAGVAASHGGRLTAEASERGAHLILELPAAAGAQRVARVPSAPRVPSAARGRLTHLGA